jgi:hypothetical protein
MFIFARTDMHFGFHMMSMLDTVRMNFHSVCQILLHDGPLGSDIQLTVANLSFKDGLDKIRRTVWTCQLDVCPSSRGLTYTNT